MEQFGKMSTLSKEEREQILSLLKNYSHKEIEMALYQLNNRRL